MSELKKIATRESYGNALAELAPKYPDLVVLDADLAAATKTGIFKKSCPERFFDCGIAEANMMGVAAGLAAAGKTVFASSFAMFAAGRAFEVVRNSIGYPHLNVKIGATHAGISVGEDGATHQCCEDFALMQAIPGMVVISPADDVEARAAVEAAINYKGPVYLRFGRLAVPVFNDPKTYHFEMGKGVTLSLIHILIRPGIVHRIDKDTSGLLIVAKNDRAHQCLAEQISAHTFTRIYNAVVYGGFREEEGTVSAPIGRHPVDRKRMAVVSSGGRQAVTPVSYTHLDVYKRQSPMC